jgi:hypothetical protein
MRIIPAIIKDGAAYPETIPDLKFGNFFDGENYFYFESEQEREAWKAEQAEVEQVPVEDEFFKSENIAKLWGKLIDSLTPQQIQKLKQKLK